MTAQKWPWAGLHPSNAWQWLPNVTTSATLAKGEDYRSMHKINNVRKTYIISIMSSSQRIQSAIADMPPMSVFSVTDFLHIGSRAAVDQSLYRLVKAGQVKRIARGIYARFEVLPIEGAAVAKALAQKSGTKLPLATQHTSTRHTLVLTPGRSRSLVVNGHTVEFRRASQRKIELAQSPQGQVLLALWNRGHKSLTTLEIRQVTGRWEESEIDKFASLIPAWLRQAVKQSNAQRKSLKLGLTGAYDWSNPLIKDTVLIGKVLEKHNFEDVVRLCAYFGVPKVKRVFRQRELGPMTQASVSRMLSNIGAAIKQEKSHAQA